MQEKGYLVVWALRPVLNSLSSYVILGKTLISSVPQFPIFTMGDDGVFPSHRGDVRLNTPHPKALRLMMQLMIKTQILW